jgi:hypothetical protein
VKRLKMEEKMREKKEREEMMSKKDEDGMKVLKSGSNF